MLPVVTTSRLAECVMSKTRNQLLSEILLATGGAVDVPIERNVLINGLSLATQAPVALDTPIQVEFGAGSTANGITIASDGTITFTVAGSYDVRLVFQYGRSGSGGTSWLYARVLQNSSQVFTSVLGKLVNQNSDFPAEFNFTITVEAGDTIKAEIMRGSEGANEGYLVADIPNAAGWNPVASAAVVVSQYKVGGV